MADETDPQQPKAELAEKQLSGARAERDQWREANADMNTYPGGQGAWDKEHAAKDKLVDDRQAEFGQALKSSTPDELEKLQGHLEQKKDALESTIEERQGLNIAAWRAQRDAKKEHGQAEDQTESAEAGSMSERLSAQRAAKEQDQGQGTDDQGTAQDHSAVGHRMRPKFGAYATSVDEHNADKQLEQDQITMHQRLGRRATNEEMQQFESDRATEKQGAQTAAPHAAKAEESWWGDEDGAAM